MEKITCVPVRIEIRDNLTGEVRAINDELPVMDESREVDCYLWEEGNFACDCNRADKFHGYDSKEPSFPCGNKRFDIRISLENGTILYEEF